MKPVSELSAVFLAHVPREVTTWLGDEGGPLEQRLNELWTDGRTAWPDVPLPAPLFVQYLARHVPAAPPIFSSGFVADLFLACACAHGMREALDAFERCYLRQMAGFLLRTERDQDLVNEALQVLRTKLLVAPPGGSPKIADYSGRGSLLSWVRTAAVNTTRSLRRHQPPDADAGDAAMRALPTGQDPELEFIKQQYRQEFKDAFAQALASLPVEQRHVVRLHYVDGLSIDQIGALLHLHRATVARRRAEARQQILKEVRRLLRERLHLSPTEFDSLAGLIRSQLDVSIARYLGPL